MSHHPRAPNVPDAEVIATLSIDFQPPFVAETPQQFRCKHGTNDCERCGHHPRRDAAHTTIDGRGAIARLRGAR